MDTSAIASAFANPADRYQGKSPPGLRAALTQANPQAIEMREYG
jgi:hypothetical protein